MVTLVIRALFSSAALALAVGCSMASGSSWVREPESGFFPNDDVAPHASEQPPPSLVEPLAPTTSGLDEALPPRPRLARTVTLGETVSASTDRAPESRIADRSNVNVTINNYVTPERNDYDGYAYAVPLVRDVRHDGGNRPARPATRPSRPGQSWPAPPSHGPAFPFKTAPASPWAPDR